MLPNRSVYSRLTVRSDPSLLLSGSAYGGGATLRVDLFHAAGRALLALRLAAETWNEEILETALAIAADAIAQHGVPPEITDVHSIGSRAEDFSASDLIAALYIPRAELATRSSFTRKILNRLHGHSTPTIRPTQWIERVDAAATMIGARASMPFHHRVRSEVTAYTEAVTNPLVAASLVVRRGEDLGQVLTEWSERDGPVIHE